MKPVRLAIGAFSVVVGVLLAMWLVAHLPGSLNPFDTKTVDRSQPPVLQSIESIGEYRASSANLQLVVDLEKDTRFVPSFIKGDRTLFVAAGNVDAGVDLGSLDPDAIEVDEGRRSVRVTLPAPRLYDPEVDLDRSYLVSRERGVLDRIGGFLTDNGDQRDVLLLAEDRLSEAAAADPRVLEQARTNTRAMLTALLGSLGFTDIEIVFADPAAEGS